MMLVEQAEVPVGALPVQAFRDHLRLGTGFADDGIQDSVLEGCLRAAIAAIEGKTSKALLDRPFKWTVNAWRDLGRQTLPLAPVSAVTTLRIVDRTGVPTLIDPSRYRLEPDAHRPSVVAIGLVLPTIPVAGTAEIEFTAGYGPAWQDVPGDLRQAVLLLAAHYYEIRHQTEAQSGGIPAGVASLLERYRNLRLFGSMR